MIKKIILILTALIFTITPLFILVPSASAVSDYDQAYRTIGVEDMSIEMNNYGSNNLSCDEFFIGLNWSDFIQDEDNWRQKTQTYYDFRDNFNDAINNDGAWGVTKRSPSSGYEYITIFFSKESYTHNLNWFYNPITEAQTVNLNNVYTGGIYFTNYLTGSGTNCKPVLSVNSANPNPGAVLVSNNSNAWNFFIHGYNPNYPVDYEGELVQEEAPTPKTNIYPRFSYSINQQGQVTVHYLSSNLIQNPQSIDCTMPAVGAYNLRVSFYKGSTLLQTRDIDCTEPIFDFQTDGLGDYSIEMEYINAPDLELPPPYLYQPLFPLEGYNPVKSIVNFSYIGFIVSGSNTQPQADCTAGSGVNSCDVQNEFNDCDWADFGCHLSNFIIQLQIWVFNMLYAVFGITPNQIPQIEQIFSFELDTHGLTSVVTAPLSVFNNLISSSYTCSPLNLPLPNLDNKNIVLPCLTPIYEDHFSSGFVMYQTIITGIAFYYVTVNLLRHFKELTDPKKDSIEVIKL